MRRFRTFVAQFSAGIKGACKIRRSVGTIAGMDTIRSLVDRFGGGASLARKLADFVDEPVSEEAIYKWVKRERIASRWHLPLLKLARAERVPLSAEGLIELATPRRDERRETEGAVA